MKRTAAQAVRAAGCALCVLAAGASWAQSARPAELDALLAKALPGQGATAWCAIAAAPGDATAYAVAVAAPAGGGRYLVLWPDGRSSALGHFAGAADLSCRTAAQANALNETIARSGTVHGSVRPHWASTVVCGFVEPTRAQCWQYAPESREFVKVGEWIT